jgi:hypothetical protein
MKLRIMKRNSQFRSSLAGVCSVLLILGVGQSGFAQQSASAAQTATPQAAPVTEQTPAAKQESPSSGKPGNEGIKVHGHWVINVKNPDDTLAEHREFDNSLADGGQLLVGLLSGYLVPGVYGIALNGNVCPGAIVDPNCVIIPPNSTPNWQELCVAVSCSQGLTYSVNLSISGSSMVMSGTLQASTAGQITLVKTLYLFCYTFPPSGAAYPNVVTNVSPAACYGPSEPAGTLNGSGPTTGFTGTVLTPPLSVTAGQLIQVSVTISFS